MKIISLLCVLGMTLGVAARADVYLSSITFDGYQLVEGAGRGSVFTGEAGWAPIVEISDSLELRGDFALSIPKDAYNDLFFAFSYQAFLRFPLGWDFSAELGGGAQTFTARNGGTGPCASANLTYDLDDRWGFLDRLYAGYTRYWQGAKFDEIRVGLGLVF